MPGTDIVEEVCRLIRQRLPHASPGKIQPASVIGAGGLGLDSIDQVELITDLEHRFGIEMQTEVVSGDGATIASIASSIEAQMISK